MRFVVLAIVLASGVARADELDRARALEASLEYEQALAIVDGVLARGGADPTRYVELHVLAGKLAGGLDKPDLAREHFARALAVRPDTTLPDGTSPKIAIPFAAVKARSVPLVVTIAVRDGMVSLDPRDPLGLAKGIAVRVSRHAGGSRTSDQTTPSELVERTALRIAIPAGTTVIDVAALDAAGNRVWVGAPPASMSTNEPTRRASKPIYARWGTYAIVGGAALALGGIAAWRFQVAQDDWNLLHDQGGHDFSELHAIEDRGRRWTTIANISFGVAAAAAVTSLVVGIVGRPGRDRDVVVTPTTTGIGIAGHF